MNFFYFHSRFPTDGVIPNAGWMLSESISITYHYFVKDWNNKIKIIPVLKSHGLHNCLATMWHEEVCNHLKTYGLLLMIK